MDYRFRLATLCGHKRARSTRPTKATITRDATLNRNGASASPIPTFFDARRLHWRCIQVAWCPPNASADRGNTCRAG